MISFCFVIEWRRQGVHKEFQQGSFLEYRKEDRNITLRLIQGDRLWEQQVTETGSRSYCEASFGFGESNFHVLLSNCVLIVDQNVPSLIFLIHVRVQMHQQESLAPVLRCVLRFRIEWPVQRLNNLTQYPNHGGVPYIHEVLLQVMGENVRNHQHCI